MVINETQKLYSCAHFAVLTLPESFDKSQFFWKLPLSSERDCECPAPRISVAYPKEVVLKGYLKGVLEGCLIKWLRPLFWILSSWKNSIFCRSGIFLLFFILFHFLAETQSVPWLRFVIAKHNFINVRNDFERLAANK